jgi:hypothetical protein
MRSPSDEPAGTTASTHAHSSSAAGDVPPIVHQVLRSPGYSLTDPVRSDFELRFGHDFPDVRVHTDTMASDSARAVGARAESPSTVPAGSTEEISDRSSYRALERNRLRDQISDLVVAGANDYVTFRDAIRKSTAVEKEAALNPVLLANLSAALDARSFERCVELLGRRAPTFDQLRRNPTVYEAIAEAWEASNVGVNDLVTQAHEEGGWIYLNLVDGSLSVARATPQFTDAIKIEPAPAHNPNNVLVATFHTHPHLGRAAPPSSHDLVHDVRRGVPNLVSGNPGSDPAKFQIFLSGPSARRHLASDTQFPGPSGGIAP